VEDLSVQERSTRTTPFVLEVRLDDGDRIKLDAGTDAESAEAELATLHAALEAGAFVRLGDVAIVRAAEIRSARVHRLGDADGGIHNALQSRIRGSRMTTYDTERTTQMQRQGDGGPGFVDQYVGYGRRPWAETKPFWMTSEFLATLGAIAALAIALGTNDLVNGFRGWLLITIVAAAYIISRGIAKSGTREPNPSQQGRGGYGGGQGY
jgi:hypothetical protein